MSSIAIADAIDNTTTVGVSVIISP